MVGENPGQPRAGSDGSPALSVVVCTYARPQALHRCLASLVDLDDPDLEIIVVDNHLEPSLDAVEVQSRGIRYVHEPRRGLDHARNRGIAEARSPFVAYIDDDCEVMPGWSKAVVAAFQDPEVACVTGRVVPSHSDRPTYRWFEMLSTFDRGPHLRRFDPRPRRVLPDHAARLGTGCNMAFRRDVFDTVGAFDVALDMGTAVAGGGDLDMFARVLEAGHAATYEPDALVLHHHRETVRDLRRQLFGYGAAVGALSFKRAIEQRELRGVGSFQKRYLKSYWRLVRRRVRGRNAPPLSLSLAMFAGDAWGPFAYLIARRRARRATR